MSVRLWSLSVVVTERSRSVEVQSRTLELLLRFRLRSTGHH